MRHPSRLALRALTLLLAPAAVLFILALTLLADLLLPFVVHIPAEAYGFAPLHPPNTVSRTKGYDFDAVARINSLGLRGPEISLEKGDKCRILAIGSSYTYGWGLNDDECWTFLLEKRLKEAGVNAEVVNLGRNGGSVEHYVALAHEAVPLLKPDLVLVTLGQGIDVLWVDKKSFQLASWVRQCYPNGMAWWKGPRRHEQEALPEDPHLQHQAKEKAMEEAKAIYASLNESERARFDALEPLVKETFFAGDVNPGMFRASIQTPDFYTRTMRFDDPDIRYRTECLAERITEMKKIVEKNQAGLLVASMPFGIFTNESSCRNYARIGFDTVEGMARNSLPDASFQSACDAAGVNLVTVTETFRKHADNPNLYFELDLHLAPEGAALFADSLYPYVSRALGHAVPVQP